MKKLVLVFVSLFIIVIAAQNVNGQNNSTSSASASATANIITPIKIINAGANLVFGNIISSATLGEVTVDTNNNATPTGGASFPTGLEGTASSAAFTVTGLANAVYSITLPDNESIKLKGDGDEMQLKGFEHNADETLDATGNETFQVGATLVVNAGQKAGEYTTTFPVTVNYN